MDVIDKIFVTNAVLMLLTACADAIFNLTDNGGRLQRFILNPWLNITLISVPCFIIKLLWF